VNCDEYVTGYLSAHADRELTRQEERAVEEHLGAGAEDGCAACRARLAEENLLKALIRRQAPNVNAPEELKTRIRTAIDRLDGEAPARPLRTDNAVTRQLRRPSVWLPLAAASAIILALFIGSLPGVRGGPGSGAAGASSTTASKAFGDAVQALRKFGSPGGFHTNVPSASLAQIATTYGAADLPNDMWNFARTGYPVVGGQMDNLPDGTSVTYTLYRGTKGDILNMRYRASDLSVPAGAAADRGAHRFYRYKGYSLCLTMSESGHYIDILAANLPLAELEQTVSTASLTHLGK
jgi:anti-sigma factor RsiW